MKLETKRKVAKMIAGDYNPRVTEYRKSWPFLSGCESILDAACGTGTFMMFAPERMVGVDYNPENVRYCCEKGLKAQVGNIRKLPFESNSFDGVHCSHVLQCLDPDGAAETFNEFMRVLKPGGRLVITTLNSFRRFYRHPENVRPYPPDAIMRYFGGRAGATSPMYEMQGEVRVQGMWKRRPPLVELFVVDAKWGSWTALFNAFQSRIGLRKFWTYDAYVLCLTLNNK